MEEQAVGGRNVQKKDELKSARRSERWAGNKTDGKNRQIEKQTDTLG